MYLDSAATTLKPQIMVDKLIEYYTHYSSNIHRGIYSLSEKATEEYEKARSILAKFIGAQPSEITFTSGTTGGINSLAYSLGELLKFTPQDEIIVLKSEHHSNFVPWQRLAKQKKCKFIVTQDILQSVSQNTKIVAFAGASNVLGKTVDIKKTIAKIRSVNPKIIIILDGAQMVAHEQIDVKDLDCDFFVFSGHKMGGPTGVGVLWGRKNLLDALLPYQVGGGMISQVTELETTFAEVPAKFEAGTPPIAEAIALGAAAEFIESLGRDEIQKFEAELAQYTTHRLHKELSGEISIYNIEGGILSFNLKGCHPHDVAQILAEDEICIRAGHHCAQPLHDALGITASCRASFWVYNTKEDVDRLVEGLKKAKKILS